MYYYVKEEIYITESVLHFPIACEHKYYGLNCNLTCSTTCINQTCDAESGICVMVNFLKHIDSFYRQNPKYKIES